MREDPGLDRERITACLAAHYGLDVASITYLPIGYDLDAAVYQVVAREGTVSFLKVRFAPIHEASLRVPGALIDRGVPNILAPVFSRNGQAWSACDGDSLVLYPYIAGENAASAGLTDNQWRAFGATLRAVHDSGLAATMRDVVPVETFTLPSAATVRHISALVEASDFLSPAAARFAAFWREQAGRIDSMLERAETLGRTLQTKQFELVLCHADIHAANILVGGDGGITLIDWDGPLIAPRERDLLFVVESRIAREVTRREEDLFFAGYGPVPIDPDALIYYRYERIIEDIGVSGRSVLLDPDRSEAARADEAAFTMRFFAPDGDIDRAEADIARRFA